MSTRPRPSDSQRAANRGQNDDSVQPLFRVGALELV